MNTKNEDLSCTMISSQNNTRSVIYDNLIQKISPNRFNKKTINYLNTYYQYHNNGKISMSTPDTQSNSYYNNNNNTQSIPSLSSSSSSLLFQQNIRNDHSNNPINDDDPSSSKLSTHFKNLTISTNDDESAKFHTNTFGNNQGSFTTNHKNPMISNLVGNFTTRYPRIPESLRAQNLISPIKNLHYNKNIASSHQQQISSSLNQMIPQPPPSSSSSSGSMLASHGMNNTINSSLPSSTSLNLSNPPQGLNLNLSKSLTLDTTKVMPATAGMLNSPNSILSYSNTLSTGINTDRPYCTPKQYSCDHSNLLGQSTSNIFDTLNNPKGLFGSGQLMINSRNTPSSTNPITGMKIPMNLLPNHEPTKCSVKRYGIVKAYAANTNQGIVRNYNEDRVSIILNITKPPHRMNETWPKCSFFGVYDGHGGVTCADFLRDHLHQYVIHENSFPSNPKEALIKGFEAAEKAFLESAENTSTGNVDKSGSCAIVVLIVGDICYAANVGDSRAILSADEGHKAYPLSRDHKPMDEYEKARITENGGRIYQTQAPVLKSAENCMSKPQMEFVLGPHRVLPGRLSVSRTFGDIEAKLPKFGGNPNVVIAVPDIKVFKIASTHDFIVLASDGIFDKLNTKEVVKCIWDSTEQEETSSIHQQCSIGVEYILKEAINKKTLDNITVVMICFKNFKAKLFPRSKGQLSIERFNDADSQSQLFIKSPKQQQLQQHQQQQQQQQQQQYNFHIKNHIIKPSKKDDQENYPHPYHNQPHSHQPIQPLVHLNPLKKMTLLGENNNYQNAYNDLRKTYNDNGIQNLVSPENNHQGKSILKKQAFFYEKYDNSRVIATPLIMKNNNKSITPKGGTNPAASTGFSFKHLDPNNKSNHVEAISQSKQKKGPMSKQLTKQI